jgi:hypothetical protein
MWQSEKPDRQSHNTVLQQEKDTTENEKGTVW